MSARLPVVLFVNMAVGMDARNSGDDRKCHLNTMGCDLVKLGPSRDFSMAI